MEVGRQPRTRVAWLVVLSIGIAVFLLFALVSLRRQAYMAKSELDPYLTAEKLADIPNSSGLLHYRIAWFGSNGEPGPTRDSISGVIEVYPNHSSEPMVLIMLWLGKGSVVQHCAVCYQGNVETTELGPAIRLCSEILGKPCAPSYLPGDVREGAPLYDTEYWLREHRLRRGGRFAPSKHATRLVKESGMVDGSKPELVFFHWLADDEGRILARGMTGS